MVFHTGMRRLQVTVPDELASQICEAAQRNRSSVSAWVRKAIERRLADEPSSGTALDQLARLNAPTADIDQMLAEIRAGRASLDRQSGPGVAATRASGPLR